jgi:hypothetical protein
VARTIEDDRTATRGEIAQHRVALRKLAAQHRLTEPQLTAEGVVIVHSDAPGYKSVGRFIVDAAALIGHRPYVITDDGPGGRQWAEPL